MTNVTTGDLAYVRGMPPKLAWCNGAAVVVGAQCRCVPPGVVVVVWRVAPPPCAPDGSKMPCIPDKYLKRIGPPPGAKAKKKAPLREPETMQ